MPYVPAALGWVQESGKCDPLHDTDILQFLHWHIQQDDPTSLHPKHNKEQLYLQEIIRVAKMTCYFSVASFKFLKFSYVVAMAKSKNQLEMVASPIQLYMHKYSMYMYGEHITYY